MNIRTLGTALTIPLIKPVSSRGKSGKKITFEKIPILAFYYISVSNQLIRNDA